MRLPLIFAVACVLHAQTASEFDKSITGQWVGTLEYRDYSEPVASAKRVKLPTWLTIEQQPTALKLAYVYDDGPSKTVTETSVLHVEADKTIWGKENFSTEGYDQLR